MYRYIENSNYQINELGVVKRQFKNGKTHFIKPTIGNNGYYGFSIENNKRVLLHRMLAKCFIENPNNLQIIDHKNRNKLDNRLENLRWVTYRENCINRVRRGCITTNKRKTEKKLYSYYRVYWNLPNQKLNCRSFKTKEHAKIFLDSLELHKY